MTTAADFDSKSETLNESPNGEDKETKRLHGALCWRFG